MSLLFAGVVSLLASWVRDLQQALGLERLDCLLDWVRDELLPQEKVSLHLMEKRSVR